MTFAILHPRDPLRLCELLQDDFTAIVKNQGTQLDKKRRNKMWVWSVCERNPMQGAATSGADDWFRFEQRGLRVGSQSCCNPQGNSQWGSFHLPEGIYLDIHHPQAAFFTSLFDLSTRSGGKDVCNVFVCFPPCTSLDSLGPMMATTPLDGHQQLVLFSGLQPSLQAGCKVSGPIKRSIYSTMERYLQHVEWNDSFSRITKSRTN